MEGSNIAQAVSVQMEFGEFEAINEKTVRMWRPSKVIPGWLEYADTVTISVSKGRDTTIAFDASVIRTDIISIDIMTREEDNVKSLSDWTGDCKITLYAEKKTSITESLTRRFLQLDYDDGFNLKSELTENIEFIYGPPGTGKTTRLANRLRGIIERPDGSKTNILVLTPTNKAADVIATKLVEDESCRPFTTRFGYSESEQLVDVMSTRSVFDIDSSDRNIVVTTAARFAYDYFQPNDTPVCDFGWDYIAVDEASMIDIITMTYILHKGKDAKFIIAGDPKQIQPVKQNDIDMENIYQMVGLDSFRDAIGSYKRYHVETLKMQHRSTPVIGSLISRFAYDGLVVDDPVRSPQKELELDCRLQVNDINFVGFDVKPLDNLYGLTSIKDSAFHLYSAIFTYSMACYVARQLSEKHPECNYSIGIVSPYKAEADAIQQMFDRKPLQASNCTVSSGTVHKFQGDECDIMFIVLNPPLNISSGSHINNVNIINVAMSRARDYIFFIMPKGQQEGFDVKNRLGALVNDKCRSILYCEDVEKVIFGDPKFIDKNTNVTCHLPVNVYYDSDAIYEVRMDDDAIDIQITDKDYIARHPNIY